MLDRVIETYNCILSCRKKMPGMSLESAIDTNAVRQIEKELEWLKKVQSDPEDEA